MFEVNGLNLTSIEFPLVSNCAHLDVIFYFIFSVTKDYEQKQLRQNQNQARDASI